MFIPRSVKKLVLLLLLASLIFWVVIFSKYLQSQPFSLSLPDSQGLKIVVDQGIHSPPKGALQSKGDTDRKELTKDMLLAFRQMHKSKMDPLRAPLANRGSDFQNINSEVAQDLISRIKVNCRNNICSEFVTKADKPHFDYCIKKTWKLRSKYREPRDSVCRFVNGTGRNPIALASFPGSGNTWVRGLIQGITGLCTGAIYCDRALRQTGFPGESIRSGIVLVVKTHHDDPRWTGIHYSKSAPFSYFKKVEHIPMHSAAIFILRNPFDSLVSEYSRLLRVEQPDSHINLPEREYFGTNSDWNDFVHEQAVIWERTVLAWVSNNHNHPVLVVKYEDLKKDTLTEVKRMLDFLQVPYSESRLTEVVSRGYSTYKRQHVEKFDHYTTEQREVVRSAIERVSRTLHENSLLVKANVSSYL